MEQDTDTVGSEEDFCDAEILDEMTTHRGELKLITTSRNHSFSDDRHIHVNDFYRIFKVSIYCTCLVFTVFVWWTCTGLS